MTKQWRCSKQSTRCRVAVRVYGRVFVCASVCVCWCANVRPTWNECAMPQQQQQEQLQQQGQQCVLRCVVHCGSGNFKARKHFCLPNWGGVGMGVAKAACTHWEEMPHYAVYSLHGHMCPIANTRARTWVRCCCLWINSHSLRDCASPQEGEGEAARDGAAGTQFSVGTQLCCQFGLFHLSRLCSQCCCCCNLFSCRHLQPVRRAQTYEYSAIYVLFIYVLCV